MNVNFSHWLRASVSKNYTTAMEEVCTAIRFGTDLTSPIKRKYLSWVVTEHCVHAYVNGQAALFKFGQTCSGMKKKGEKVRRVEFHMRVEMMLTQGLSSRPIWFYCSWDGYNIADGLCFSLCQKSGRTKGIYFSYSIPSLVHDGKSLPMLKR